MSSCYGFSNSRALLVEDDRFVRDSLTLALKTNGCFVKAVKTAEEGLDALVKGGFDVIISDYWLPGMNGLNFLDTVKVKHPEVAMMMISGYEDEDIESKAFKIGVDSYLKKPVSTQKFFKTLNQLINSK